MILDNENKYKHRGENMEFDVGFLREFILATLSGGVISAIITIIFNLAKIKHQKALIENLKERIKIQAQQEEREKEIAKEHQTRHESLVINSHKKYYKENLKEIRKNFFLDDEKFKDFQFISWVHNEKKEIDDYQKELGKYVQKFYKQFMDIYKDLKRDSYQSNIIDGKKLIALYKT